MMFFLPERGLRIRDTDTRCQHPCSTHFQSWFWSWWSSLQFILDASHCNLFPNVRTRDGWVGSANATSVAGWIIIDLTGPMARSFFLAPELCRQVTWHWAISNFQSTNKSSFLFVLVSFRASDQYFTASAIISNEVPSDVNISVDGSTYPRWKMSCFQKQKLFLDLWKTQ